MNPLALYLAIGVISGILVAWHEYEDGVDSVSAGAAGFFVVLFWPVVLAVLTLGVIAFGLSQLIHKVKGLGGP